MPWVGVLVITLLIEHTSIQRSPVRLDAVMKKVKIIFSGYGLQDWLHLLQK